MDNSFPFFTKKGKENFAFNNSLPQRIAFFASSEEVHINSYEWMTDTLNQIGNHPVNKLSELLPNHFRKV